MAEAKKAQQFSPVENPAQHLQENNEKLAKYGGFDLLEACVEGVQNMNPERKARKKIFLTESSKKEGRSTLKKTLEIWLDALSTKSIPSCLWRSPSHWPCPTTTVPCATAFFCRWQSRL